MAYPNIVSRKYHLIFSNICYIIQTNVREIAGGIMLTLISADIMEKLKILSDAAKFDVACTSSGASRSGNGNTVSTDALMMLKE